MIPKKNEDTITVLLSKKLDKRGIHTACFSSLGTPKGTRKPDIFCTNGGHYVIEAKFSEKDLFGAVAKIQNDYLKHSKLLGLNGGFALLYPQELSKSLPIEKIEELAEKLDFKIISLFPPEDRRNCGEEKGTLNWVADFLAQHILQPPEKTEPAVGFMINTLRGATDFLVASLRDMASHEFEHIFGGQDVFENILQYEKHEYPIEEMKLATAYLLVNQLLFYQILSSFDQKKFPEINTDALKSPSDLKDFFKKIPDYQVIYSFDVASKIPPKDLDNVISVIEAIKGIAPGKVRYDLLGTIFHDLIPFEPRKKVAAFYTNTLAADLLARLAVKSKDDKVADLAVGSGGLLVGAYKKKKELISREEEFSEPHHKKFVEEDLLGIDIMPFAAHLAATHLALQTPNYVTDKVRIAVWDSTELKIGSVIPPIAGIQYVLKGQSSLKMFDETNDGKKGSAVVRVGTAEEITLDEFDVVIMNPPFTRQERIPEQYKMVLTSRFSEHQKYLHGQMGYYNYFILLADRMLKEGGTLAFVLPATFLRVRSSELIRHLLLEKYNIKYIISNRELNFSESTWRREILLVATKNNGKKSKYNTIIATLSNLPKNETEIEKYYVKLLEAKKKKKISDKDLLAITKTKDELIADQDNWFKYIAISNPLFSEKWQQLFKKSQNLVKLKDFLQGKNGSIIRGIETSRGMNVQATFILSTVDHALRRSDRWVVSSINKSMIIAKNRFYPTKKVNVPQDCCIDAFRTLSNSSQMELPKITDHVAIKSFPEVDTFFDNKRLVRILPTWKRYVEDRMGKLFVLRRFVLPAPGTTHLCYIPKTLSTVTGTAWIIKGIDDESSKILSLWFNSSIHILQLLLERIEDVWIDLHEYALESMLVIAPSKLTKKHRKKLLTFYKKFSKAQFPSLVKQFENIPLERRELDRLMLEIMGFPKEKIDKELYTLYENVGNELKILEKIMHKQNE